ncbi:hypothetical protein EF808_04565 [archaeon]|nr:MAG: hypothetical protein EF808_04565 [archaeon]
MDDDYEKFEGVISREEFERKVNEKIKEFQGLLTREGAISILASELGVTLSQPKDVSITISDIKEGMTNIDIVGKIARISEVKQFVRRTTGTTGKILSLELADETGTIRVALWDDDADAASTLNAGDTIEVVSAYAKKGLNNSLELSLSRKGTVKRSDAEVDVPVKGPEHVEIASLAENMYNVTLVGVVAGVSDVREYERSGRSFKVCSLFLRDNTGQVRVSLWNKHAERTRSLSMGDVVRFVGCHTKMGLNGVEVQTNSYTQFETNPDIDGLSLPTIDADVQLSELSTDNQFFSVRGVVTQVYEPRSFFRDDGTEVMVGSLEIEDGTGSCKVTLWEEKAEILSTLAPGTSLCLEGCRAREGLDGLEISIGRTGRVTPSIPDEVNQDVPAEGLARVVEAKDGALKVASTHGRFTLLTDDEFEAGTLVRYAGTVDGTQVSASSVTRSDEHYPSLDELTSPPRHAIEAVGAGRLVSIAGLVRAATKVREDCILLRVDDGTGTITGYCSDGVDEGREYAFIGRTIDNGVGVEFVSQDLQPIDAEREAYRLLEEFGEYD